MNTQNTFKLTADGITVWSGTALPNDEIVDKVASRATSLGWNGTEMDLLFEGEIISVVYPNFN